MTFPTLLLALLIALLCGVVFHVFRGGGGWRLVLYMVLSVLGFAIGQGISMWRGWNLISFGSLDIGMGVIGSAMILAFGEWLVEVKPKEKAVYNLRPLDKSLGDFGTLLKLKESL